MSKGETEETDMKLSTWTYASAALVAGIALFLIGCSDKGDVTAPPQPNFETSQFVVLDYSDVQNAIEDGTLDTPMTFNATILNDGFLNGTSSFGPGDPAYAGMQWYIRFDFRKHLGMFFQRLNLTGDQKTQIRALAQVYHTAMKPLVQQFYDANKDIIAAANATRKSIVDSLKAGTITRVQTSSDLKGLNQATHAQIDANPASVTIKETMCSERDKLFAGIAAVLQGDQLTAWNNWISNMTNPCAP
jgi:hypothetical protein